MIYKYKPLLNFDAGGQKLNIYSTIFQTLMDYLTIKHFAFQM